MPRELERTCDMKKKQTRARKQHERRRTHRRQNVTACNGFLEFDACIDDCIPHSL